MSLVFRVGRAEIAVHSLKDLRLGSRPMENRHTVPEGDIAYLKGHGVWYPDMEGNKAEAGNERKPRILLTAHRG